MTPFSGICPPEFAPVQAAFESNFAEGEELGAGFAVWLDGTLVIDLHGGWRDRSKTLAWDSNTLVPVYSTTKPIAALVIARLVDAGLIDYEAPLAQYWPEFAAHGKDRVRVAEALSHQAGVPGFAEPIDPALWLDPPALSAALAGLAPMWTPGNGSGYHPLTWGYLAGELVARVSPRSLGTILREEICQPLGIDFHIGTPASEHARCAEIKRPAALPDLGAPNAYRRAAFLTRWSSPNKGGAVWRETEIPSANGHGTAASVARLYGAYAHGGRIGDMQLFAAQTWQELTRQRCRGDDRVLPFELSFATGVMRNDQLVYGPNPGTLAHSGWGGSVGLADPDRGLSAAYVMNRQSNRLQGDPRAMRLVEALYDCL